MSWVVLSFVTLLAAAAVWRSARRSREGWALAVAVGLSPLLGLALPEPSPPPPGVPRATAPGVNIGSSACAACHPGEHATWSATYHRTMTQVAQGRAITAPHGTHEVVVDGRTIRVEHGDGGLTIAMPDPAELQEALLSGRDPASVAVVPRRAALTTGSHHYQAYWVQGRRQGELRAAPVVWHHEAQRFIPRHEVFLQPPQARDHLVRWNSNCLVCHATGAQPRHDPSRDAFDTEAVELGVACEACHGPGGAHARRFRDPMQRWLSDGEPGDIVNPAKLDKARSSEVCGQCHSYAFPRDESDWWEHGYTWSYRPGAELAASRHLLGFEGNAGFAIEAQKESLFWGDGTIRVGGRELNGLVASSCFTQGSGERRIACVDCHRMHGAEPDDQLSEAGQAGGACRSCHLGKDSESHTHHAAGSAGASCEGCHMPRIAYALYRAQRSHRIDSPSARVTEATGRPAACNLCHIDKSLRWTQEQLAGTFGVKGEAPGAEALFEDAPWALRTALRGDAAARVVLADNLGSPEAIAAAGAEVQLPVLASLLDDPYAAVRFVAARRLREMGVLADGGRPGIAYDFLAPEAERATVREVALDATLRAGPGAIDRALLERERALRDDRPIFIAE